MALACPKGSAKGFSSPSTACLAPANAQVAWGWVWRWCAPSLAGTMAVRTVKTGQTDNQVPVLCCAYPWREKAKFEPCLRPSTSLIFTSRPQPITQAAWSDAQISPGRCLHNPTPCTHTFGPSKALGHSRGVPMASDALRRKRCAWVYLFAARCRTARLAGPGSKRSTDEEFPCP